MLQVYETTCNDAVNDYADLAFNVALQVRHTVRSHCRTSAPSMSLRSPKLTSCWCLQYVQDPRATCVQLGICTGPAGNKKITV